MAFQTNCPQVADLLQIVNVALQHGWFLTLKEAIIIWEGYSDDLYANWLILDGLSHDDIWGIIQEFKQLITWKTE